MKTINAKIEGTMLGYEDHGILTYSLGLDLGGNIHQSFGGFALFGDSTDLTIRNILDAVGVENWESLKGKYIRIKVEDGWNGKILEIGNLLEDKWFDPLRLTN